MPGSGVFGPWALTDAGTGTAYRVALFDHPDGHFYVPISAKLKDETQMIGWQSYLLKERLVGFVGLRCDDMKTYGLVVADVVRQDFRTPGDRAGLYRSFE